MFLKPKQMYKNWCITIPNYTQEDEEWFKEMYKTNVFNYFIFGRRSLDEEVPHLYGYIQFTEGKRITGVRKLHWRGHWENAPYTAKHCRERYSTYADVQTMGILVSQGGRPKKVSEAMGSEYQQPSTSGASLVPNLPELLENADEQGKKQMEVEAKPEEETEEEKKTTHLKNWQYKALQLLKVQNRRQILFVVDTVGHQGKTYFAKYLNAHHEAVYFENDKDVRCMFWELDYHAPMVVFDLNFKQGDKFNMRFYENLKDGMIEPYEDQPYKKPVHKNLKLIVLTNIEPNPEVLRSDRVLTMYIEENNVEDRPLFPVQAVEKYTDDNKRDRQNLIDKCWVKHNSKPK